MPRKGRGRLTPLTARRANMTRRRHKTPIAISLDLCDGTRMVFQRMCSHVLEAHILTVPKVEHTAKPWLQEPVFTHGQLYVAFSSVRTLDSIHVKMTHIFCSFRFQSSIHSEEASVFTKDLCDGTRMVFQRMCSHVLEAHILTVPKVEHTAKPWLQEPVFTHGQLYVAFSSVRTLDSIHVKMTHIFCSFRFQSSIHSEEASVFTKIERQLIVTGIQQNAFQQYLKKSSKADQEDLRGVLLHHGNARPHTSAKTLDFLANSDVQLVTHPPYSPDLAPCDFFYIQKLWIKFYTEDEALQAFINAVNSIPEDDWCKCFDNWFSRMKSCIGAKDSAGITTLLLATTFPMEAGEFSTSLASSNLISARPQSITAFDASRKSHPRIILGLLLGRTINSSGCSNPLMLKLIVHRPIDVTFLPSATFRVIPLSLNMVFFNCRLNPSEITEKEEPESTRAENAMSSMMTST
ncbi:hypothetical protein LAZ67_13001443 [Cordylochernes scorpioides]|uniref:Transposase n=1 Tax=Cordylochernes scorpioides TaxID=51811 RepID=A0ABY6L3V9_9ARAC|nr:hypothetical protein LAZ67_13001443 [Cordylochernes scorpioides]